MITLIYLGSHNMMWSMIGKEKLPCTKKKIAIPISQTFTLKKIYIVHTHKDFFYVSSLSIQWPFQLLRHERGAILERSRAMWNLFVKNLALPDAVTLRKEQEARLAFSKEDFEATYSRHKSSRRHIHSLLSLLPILPILWAKSPSHAKTANTKQRSSQLPESDMDSFWFVLEWSCLEPFNK